LIFTVNSSSVVNFTNSPTVGGISLGFGYTGSRGFTGSQGTGFTGSRGDVGFAGSFGFTGSRGFTGSIGFVGSQGVIGFTGSTGPGSSFTNPYGDIFTITNTTNATSTITGALQVVGGVGVRGNLYVGGLVNVDSLTIDSVFKINDGAQERYTTLTTATGIVVYNCSNSQIFFHNTATANWTANFTNLALDVNYATTICIIITQGSTGYYPATVQIAGNSQTLNWQGNTLPTPSTNRRDVATFSILRQDAGYIVFGQLIGF
jgi:hypothetical protein